MPSIAPLYWLTCLRLNKYKYNYTAFEKKKKFFYRPLVIRGPNTRPAGTHHSWPARNRVEKEKHIEYIFFKHLPSFLLSEANSGKDMYNHKKRDIIS